MGPVKPLDLTTAQAPFALSALRAVALADGRIADAERELLSVHADLLGYEGDLDALPELDLDALSAALPDPAHRAALVQRLVLMAMLDGEIAPAEIARTREIADRLGVIQPAIAQMQHFLAGRMKLLSFDLMRRSFVATKVGRVWREEGLRGLAKIAKQSRGKPDPELAARYTALGELPEGTLGKELFRHFRRNGLPLPGEEKSAPEALLFHDVGHVLAGYDTDPEGEVQMAGFEAAYMREDGFSVTLLALYLFHLGADLGLDAKPSKARFALQPFRAAFARGAALAVDLREWDPWPHVSTPVDVLRQELGVS